MARAAAGRREAFTYRLVSGREGKIHIEPVLEYNWDPGSMRSRLLDKLTLEAQGRLEQSPLSRRDIIRRLDTSPAQSCSWPAPSLVSRCLPLRVGSRAPKLLSLSQSVDLAGIGFLRRKRAKA